MQAKRRGTWGAVVLAVGLLVSGSYARAGVHIKLTLQSTGIDPDARGNARVEIEQHGGRGKLSVKAKKLGSSSTFDVVLGGVRIGSLTTNGSGNGTAKFSSRPHHHEQLLGVDPRGKRLEVQNAGEDVLHSDVPDDSVDPGDVVCCVHDDDEEDEVECRTTSADRCARKHGTVSTAPSCIPDPCGSTSGDTIRCCKPDDDGTECQQISAAECSEHHGVNLGVGACDPNPCAATTPDVVRCCVRDHEGDDDRHGGDRDDDDRPTRPECEHLTAEHCAAKGGTPRDAGSCDPNPCSPSGAFVGEGGPLF